MKKHLTGLLAIPLILCGAAGMAATPGRDVRFLTETTSDAPALEIALDYLRGHDLEVTHQYVSRHNGTTHIHLRQRLGGLAVIGSETNVNVARDGRIISVGHRLVPNLEALAASREPMLTVGEAVFAAAAQLGLEAPERLVEAKATDAGPERRTWVSGPGLSLSDIPVRLVWHVRDGRLRLAWDLVIEPVAQDHHWNLFVDAATGEILARHDWMAHDTYEVFALPTESPDDGPRTLEVDPADPTFSPFGWHDTNGVSGPEFTTTRGNNVCAQADLAGNQPTCGAAFLPDCDMGGPMLDCVFPLDLSRPPAESVSASVTNLFYLDNALHDILAHHGFDEASGNFQETNYSGQGLGSDSVLADSQDGSGTNGGNFSTPPDGTNPRMQMFVWTLTTPNRDASFDAGVVAHEYCHGPSMRLTGGAANSNCLSASQSAGEGWSDLCSIFFTAKATDTATTPRTIGSYLFAGGFRDFPYTTDMVVNPLTYGDLATVSVPHGVGTVWATAIWEVYWNLVDAHGFDPDFATGTGGNNVAVRLVVDGLKLQPCNPTFLDARDAILLADLNNSGGANQCLIWTGFAKRGMGLSADDGGSPNSLDVTEAFDLPSQCAGADVCGNGVCEATNGEDCTTCPGDCISGTSSGASCGNGVCEAGDGEDCLSCAADCNGVQGGKPSGRFCCGDGDGENPLPCSDAQCSTGGFSCTDIPSSPTNFCCGDLACEGGETCSNCAVDCSLGAEVCSGGVDEDCDGDVDCDDLDCVTAPECGCDNDGVCEVGEDCNGCGNDCTGQTGGKPSGRFCCGDGTMDGAEGDGTICDGNF